MGRAQRNPTCFNHERKVMGFAEFIIGPAEGRTRWLYPSYDLLRQALGLKFSISRSSTRAPASASAGSTCSAG